MIPSLGNDLVAPYGERCRREGVPVMLFWMVAALSVVGVVAIVWGVVPVGPSLALASSSSEPTGEGSYDPGR